MSIAHSKLVEHSAPQDAIGYKQKHKNYHGKSPSSQCCQVKSPGTRHILQNLAKQFLKLLSDKWGIPEKINTKNSSLNVTVPLLNKRCFAILHQSWLLDDTTEERETFFFCMFHLKTRIPLVCWQELGDWLGDTTLLFMYNWFRCIEPTQVTGQVTAWEKQPHYVNLTNHQDNCSHIFPLDLTEFHPLCCVFLVSPSYDSARLVSHQIAITPSLCPQSLSFNSINLIP